MATVQARIAHEPGDLLVVGPLRFGPVGALGQVQRDGDHAALLVETATEPIVADVGFPLPALFPARAGSVETPLGELEIAETDVGIRIALRGGVPEGPRAFDLFTAPVPPQRFDELWRETYRPGSRFLLEVNLRRDLGNRVLSFAAGEIRVDDRHTRLRLSPAGPAEAALSELFGMAPELLSRAFARTGRRAAAAAEPILTAYLETHVSAGQAYAALASPAGYRGLVEGIGEVVGETDAPGGFRIALAAPGTSAASIVDEVTLDPGELRVSVRRASGKSVHVSSYRSAAWGGRTYLLREAVVPGSGPELLRNDSFRGRLAGSLAVDLLAWARRL